MSVLFGPLSVLWSRLGARPYDAMYRRGAPWDTGPRAELVALLESGRLTTAIGPRALDVGCGTGADCRLLAGHGFDVVGVDFSAAALARARAAGGPPRYVQADLFALPPEVTGEPFDLIFDGGTIDDLPPAGQRKAAVGLTSLARPGSVLVMWCFSVHREDAPWFSLDGPSRLGGMGIIPEQVHDLFGAHWEIEDLPTAHPAQRAACYWMTRRSDTAGPGGAR
jgi:SAM-dependent methyltransferase